MLTFFSLERVVVTTVAAVFVVAAAGCGSVAPVDTFETHEASASALRACGPSGTAICERAQACSPFWFARIYTSIATCAAVFTEKCVDRYRGEGASAAIADCTGAVTSLTCEELLDPVLGTLDPSVLITACPVTPGVFGAGDRCLRDGDCTTGHCAWHGHSGCGTCVAPVVPVALEKVGGACSSSTTCGSRWCSSSGTCGAPAQLGEPCGERPCDLLAGLTCGSDSVCRPFGAAALGQACSWTDSCVAGAVCMLDENWSSGKCERQPTAGVGEDCTLGCAGELTCTAGKCAAPTPGLLRSCEPSSSPQ